MSDAMILAFNLDAASCARLDDICASLSLGVSHVPAEACGLPLGALLGLPAARLPGAAPAGFEDPMLVMCGLDEARFNAFLHSLRFSGIPRIDLKAVLTPHNIAWTPAQLRDELAREHAEVLRQQREGR